MVFAVYVSQAARTAAGHAVAHDLACRCVERTLAVLRENVEGCELALTADDGLRSSRGKTRDLSEHRGTATRSVATRETSGNSLGWACACSD